jgi:hypothetical protein
VSIGVKSLAMMLTSLLPDNDSVSYMKIRAFCTISGSKIALKDMKRLISKLGTVHPNGIN